MALNFLFISVESNECFILIQRFPFDMNNPIGYLIAFALQYMLFACMFLNISCFASLGIGAYMFAIAGCKDSRGDICQMNARKVSKIAAKYQAKIMKQLSRFVLYHSQVKQLSICALLLLFGLTDNCNRRCIVSFRLFHDFSDVFQPLFVVVFSWSMLTICSALLIIQTEIVE